MGGGIAPLSAAGLAPMAFKKNPLPDIRDIQAKVSRIYNPICSFAMINLMDCLRVFPSPWTRRGLDPIRWDRPREKECQL